ncbi:ABC transporter ATP-binding protein [Phaeacidiphilus oryzae]|uniref:ABC transporter ATP-binding protein n=1 Tax=Phaeacidiphilus oryzae TaxID=348818 RepID=UPI0007C6697E|nr:ATP-binding cassette domain-containing protein [Phaeacidiphilus oryzae]
MEVAAAVAPPDNDVLWARGLVTAPREGAAALREVSIGVRQGEVLAVTGVRGSGKTTLLDCLGAARAIDSGEIWFNSAPVHILSRAGRERLRRERFGRIGSEPALVPELTVRENVALPMLLAGGPAAGRRAALRAADEWLERLDVADRARRRARQLPPEEQQRVAVARALAHSPTVVLADEPTAPVIRAADRDQLMRMLVTATRSHGLTLLLATTDRELAARYADRAAEMSAGRLGPPRAVSPTATAAGGQPGLPAPGVTLRQFPAPGGRASVPGERGPVAVPVAAGAEGSGEPRCS